MDKIREHENLRGCAEGMLIRTEEPGDFDIVRELVRLSFKDMEESDHTEHLLVDRIRRSDAYIPALSLVAEVPGAGVVGHVMLSKVEVVSEKGSVALPGVAPLSVLPAPDECCMAVEFRPGSLDGVHGEVRYPSVFFE